MGDPSANWQGHTANRNGFIVDALVGEASGTAEREAAVRLVNRQQVTRGPTLGADKACDTRDFCRRRLQPPPPGSQPA